MSRILVSLLPLMLVLGVSGEISLAAAPQPRLIVTPAQVHQNGTIYLSGAVFPAGQRLAVGYSCTGRGSFAVAESGREPQTDAHGRFAGYALQVPRAIKPGSRCSVQADIESGNQRVIRSNRFAVFAPSQPLNGCSRHICVKVRAFLTRALSGAWGHVIIIGWPGSRANVTVVRIGKDRHRSLRLDWQGEGIFKVWVAPGLVKGLKASVRATDTMGTISGYGTGTFAVIPGGR